MIRGKRYFHYVGIKETPFTLVVSLPDRYGTYHIQHALHKEDIHRQVANKNDISKYFTGDKWKIHPDWYAHTAVYQQHVLIFAFVGFTVNTSPALSNITAQKQNW